ncbi:tetratricopeptide repeat protein [Komarekiella sp. 'clone 1']|uniref:Tetratricopeptide repeat protein n=1 Tax=Komarekiella delphini-convector SJRDD-AB1 TaxID=2593771 RepID=A0AA40VQP1_9NOST|nr:tetratricopeptide repeat protein [Komarekiella delphini-convector]MBD6616170.1 tetratricopeptide repeat protein [Komarekiella delphini-convector SJRDD-AB1]
MTDLRRLFFSVIIALFLISTPTAHSLPLVITQITAGNLFELGVDKMRRGDYLEAVKNFNQAIELQKDFTVAYSNRCLAYLQLQDYHQAIADCTQAINFAPNNFEAYLNRGLAHYRQSDYPAAIANYNRAIALKPDDFRAYYNRGVALAGEGNYSEAIVDYNQALTQIPQITSLLLADIYNDRGLAHLVLQNQQAAMLDFNLAIRLNANDDRAYFNRGCACGRNGDDFGAVDNFSEVIRLNPSNALAYVNRGIARYRLGYHQGAIADLKKASEYFQHQGKRVAYQKTLDLLKSLRQEIQLATEIALF